MEGNSILVTKNIFKSLLLLPYLYSTFGNISYTYIHIYKMTYIQYYSLKYLFIFENVFVIKGMVKIIMTHLYIKKYVLKS